MLCQAIEFKLACLRPYERPVDQCKVCGVSLRMPGQIARTYVLEGTLVPACCSACFPFVPDSGLAFLSHFHLCRLWVHIIHCF